MDSYSLVEYYNEEHFGKKEELELKKNEEKNLQLFMQNSYRLQILLTKSSILSDRENLVFILTFNIFEDVREREREREFTDFKNQLFLEKKRGVVLRRMNVVVV